MSKLPKVVVKDSINRTCKNYPTLDDIFSNYKEALKTLSRTASATKKVHRDSKKPNGNSPSAVQVKEAKAKIPTVQSFETAANKGAKILCKLCSSDGNSIGKCETYSTYRSKMARILELSLCTRCAGSDHKKSECYGKKGRLKFQCLICRKREHITLLCPNQNKTPANTGNKVNLCYALRNLDISNILPTMTLELKN